MKALFLFFTLFCFLYANHINWLGDYSKALKLAKKENKPLMVLLVKQKCADCSRCIAEVFTNKPYVNVLNQKVISVIVTKENKMAYPIELLYSTHFPTLFFIDSKNEIFINEPFYGVITEKDVKKLLFF